MSKTNKSPQSGDLLTEYCPECDRESSHLVRIELRTESSKPENTQFSREPYRVSVCQICDSETTIRMNNA